MRFEFVVLICVVWATAMRALAEFYNHRSTFLHRLLVGTAQIILLVVLNAGLAWSLGAGYAGVACAVITGMFGEMIHFFNLIGERKYGMTEKEKAELMDM